MRNKVWRSIYCNTITITNIWRTLSSTILGFTVKSQRETSMSLNTKQLCDSSNAILLIHQI